MSKFEDGIVWSPYHEKDDDEAPEVSITSYMLSALRKNITEWKDRLWVVDTISGTSVTFGELEGLTLSVASALTRLGFKQNQVFYYSTYDMAHLYVIQFAVWRLGGAVRGCYQKEVPEEYARQIRETRSQFILMDPETAPTLKKAITTLDYDVIMLSIGEVEGATSVNILMQDDGSAFVNVDAKINPKEDVVVIPNTSGSTGVPKGVMHTHQAAVAAIHGTGMFVPGLSLMTLMMNYAIGNFLATITSVNYGITNYNIGKFSQDIYFKLVMKYKPTSVMMYPFMATWFSRSPELDELDLRFLENIVVGGSVLDPTTADLLSTRLPNIKITQMYGLTEAFMVSSTMLIGEDAKYQSRTLTIVENRGKQCVSSGKLLPHVQAKITNTDTGKTMGRCESGEILIRSPTLMKGYFVPGKAPNKSSIDEDGWLHTGDLGFFDEDGNIYILERLSFIFKRFEYFVSPTEIEAILQEHPAVQTVGVVGLPDAVSTSEARAFVVIRPGYKTQGKEGEHKIARELKQMVEDRLPYYKHLHGGVRFLPCLPESRGSKLDRTALCKIALENNK